MQVRCFGLVEKDHKYLLIQESSFKWRGKWFLPGGKAKKKETWESVVIRETWEEAHCNVEVHDIFYFTYHRSWFQTYLYIFYEGKTDSLSLKTEKDKESLGANWFTYEEVVKLPLRKGALNIINAYREYKFSIIDKLY